jgi:uridine kinase
MARRTAHERAAHLLERARAAPPRAGPVRLLGIDGFSGAGKTTLADDLRRADPTVTVLSIETFYLGWEGLAAGPGRAYEQLVEPLRRGEVPVVEPWDWRHDRVAPPRRRPVGPLVVVEGCGAGAPPLREALSLLVWVDADPDERERRLHARADWADYAPHRAGFERQEQALAAIHGTRAAADVVVTRAADGWFTGAADGDEWVRSGRDGDEGPA